MEANQPGSSQIRVKRIDDSPTPACKPGASRSLAWISLSTLMLVLHSARAWSFPSLPLDPSSFSNPSALIPPSVTNPIVKTIGIAAAQRPYEPATPLGSSGVDLGVEVTLSKITDDFVTALNQAGVKSSPIRVLPVPRLQLHKGMGSWAEFGISYAGYQSYRIYGGDLKIALYLPEEGPTWALRLAYSNAQLGFVHTQTWSPQLLISRALDFADPYLGVGFNKISGSIEIPLSVTVAGQPYSTTVRSEGTGSEGVAFIGVMMRASLVGLMIALEGSYSTAQAHTLGAKIGLTF